MDNKNNREDRPKNLRAVNFKERLAIENIIDDLIGSSSYDPYSASISMIASAIMGDKARYELACTQLLNTLEDQDTQTSRIPQWMQSHSFKAWMWGRVLLAADNIADLATAATALGNLHSLLNENTSPADNPAFVIWAWGYRAAFNAKEYDLSKKSMLDGALTLTKKFVTSSVHQDLSDAIWSWVMSLQATACAGDIGAYQWIKEQITSITNTTSVPQALEQSLLRTTQSNDFAAWALAKTRCAAVIANDDALYREIEEPLTLSIDNAQQTSSRAEYILSVLENQLAILYRSKSGFQ